MTERFILSSGMVLTGESHGAPDAPLILLLHGGGQSRRSWSSMAEKLGREGYRALALDMRGHGDSDWAADGDYRLDRYVEDLAEVIERAGGHAALLGASLGGLASMALAGSRPELVDAVVLADITPRQGGGGADVIRKFLRSSEHGFASLAEASAKLASDLGTRSNGDGRGLAPYLLQRDDGRYYWKWDPRVAASEHIGHLGNHPPLIALAGAITAPVLLVRTPNSSVVLDDDVAFFRELLPHAEVVETSPDVTHMVTGDNNERFGEPVGHFLRQSLKTGAKNLTM